MPQVDRIDELHLQLVKTKAALALEYMQSDEGRETLGQYALKYGPNDGWEICYAVVKTSEVQTHEAMFEIVNMVKMLRRLPAIRRRTECAM